MEHLFLINPTAGKADRSEEIAVSAKALCEELGEPCEIFVSKAAGELTRRAKEAGQSGKKMRLYACGGDGTLNEVVSGAAGFPELEIASFPCGSGNDFVKQFSHPERFFALENYLETDTRSVDLIDVNGKKSVNICSAGFDARIGTSIDRFRRHPLLSGSRAYHASVVVNLFRAVAKPCRVELEDGTVVDDKLTLVCVCNGSWYGGSYHPVPEASMRDGILDVLVVKKVSRLTVAKVIGAYQKGRYKDLPALISHYRTRSLHITTPEPEPINLDGELLLSDDLHIQVELGALRLAAPIGAW